MSERAEIVIIPRAAAERTESTQAGKLASTLLSVTVAGIADQGRFRRGREYALARAVTRITLQAGTLVATVNGSGPDPYQVTVRVVTTTRPVGLFGPPDKAQVSRLMPDGDDIDSWCTCPDGDSPCKHAVAALLCFATEMCDRPELLTAWRCDAVAAAERVAVGGRVQDSRHLRLASSQPASAVPGGAKGRLGARTGAPSSPFSTEAWHTFVGSSLELPGDWATLVDADASPTISSAIIDRVDLGATIRSAIESITRVVRGSSS